MVHLWQPGIRHVRAPERGVTGMARGNGVQDGKVCHAPKHDGNMVPECVFDMECARLEHLDCAIGCGGAKTVHMWQPARRHVRAPKRGVWKEGMGCKTERYVHAPEHDGKMVAECVFAMECATLEDLDCATGWGGAQTVHMWQPGVRHVRAPERGVSGMERGNGVQMG